LETEMEYPQVTRHEDGSVTVELSEQQNASLSVAVWFMFKVWKDEPELVKEISGFEEDYILTVLDHFDQIARAMVDAGVKDN
jgi:hypothetical protein